MLIKRVNEITYTEAVEGVLDTAEYTAAPFDSPSNRWLVTCERGCSLVPVKYVTRKIYFTAKLLQNITELAHHLLLNGTLGLDFFEVEEELESALSTPQLPEACINQLPSGNLVQSNPMTIQI